MPYKKRKLKKGKVYLRCPDCDGGEVVSKCCGMTAIKNSRNVYQCMICNKFCKIRPCECDGGYYESTNFNKNG